MPGGKPHIQSMQSQRVGNDLTTEQQQKIAGLFFSLPPVPTAGIHVVAYCLTYVFVFFSFFIPVSSSLSLFLCVSPTYIDKRDPNTSYK